MSGKTLKVNEGTNQVTYTYDCGKGFGRDFTLNVKVVPDSTVTPPSGGSIPAYQVLNACRKLAGLKPLCLASRGVGLIRVQNAITNR